MLDFDKGSLEGSGYGSMDFLNDFPIYKLGQVSFAGVLQKQITILQSNLKGLRLIEFNEYLKSAYRPRYYGNSIKTCDLMRNEIKEKLPPILLDESPQEVADETMKCSGNIFLQKQSEDYRIRMLLKSNEKTIEYIIERCKISKVLTVFLILFGILMVGVIVIFSLQFYAARKTKRTASKSFDLSVAAFDRTYIELISKNVLHCASYINEYFIQSQLAMSVIYCLLEENQLTKVYKSISDKQLFTSLLKP